MTFLEEKELRAEFQALSREHASLKCQRGHDHVRLARIEARKAAIAQRFLFPDGLPESREVPEGGEVFPENLNLKSENVSQPPTLNPQPN